jgi:hypothetical protein
VVAITWEVEKSTEDAPMKGFDPGRRRHMMNMLLRLGLVLGTLLAFALACMARL